MTQGTDRSGLARGWLRRQLAGGSPFAGDIRPWRVNLVDLGSGRPALPFPHPWNYQRPIQILEAFFWQSPRRPESQRHCAYLDVPFLAPVLVTRDPEIMKAILKQTGSGDGEFDRDTLPSGGIARATGVDSLLFSNGPLWRHQKKLAAPPFAKGNLFQPERFREFEMSFRGTIARRLQALRAHLDATGSQRLRVALEPEIKVIMLEMLVNNFFGAEIAYDELSERFVPAMQRIIDHIVADTVIRWLGVRLSTRRIQQDRKDFEELTDRVLAPRAQGRGLWAQFKSDSPDDALRSNVRVFLAGALEATTSFASWALSHLSRHPTAQQAIYEEVKGVDTYTPEELENAGLLAHALQETLRLTPSLYFLPRRATQDTWVETGDGRRLLVPKGTHVLLDVWHANRCEAFWGAAVTGYPATVFAPERWRIMAAKGISQKTLPHFGFGLGPRVCPGKHLGELEVGLVVGAILRTFQLEAVMADPGVQAGVSTKPSDGVLVELSLRPRAEPR